MEFVVIYIKRNVCIIKNSLAHTNNNLKIFLYLSAKKRRQMTFISLQCEGGKKCGKMRFHRCVASVVRHLKWLRRSLKAFILWFRLMTVKSVELSTHHVGCHQQIVVINFRSIHISPQWVRGWIKFIFKLFLTPINLHNKIFFQWRKWRGWKFEFFICFLTFLLLHASWHAECWDTNRHL